MSENTQSKLTKAAVVLLILSSAFTMLLVTLVFLHATNILQGIFTVLTVTVFSVGSFLLSEVPLSLRIIIPLLFICLAVTDLICSLYILKNSKVFRYIAIIRSLLSGLLGIWLTFDRLMSIGQPTAQGQYAILEGPIYFVYYGTILFLLLISRKDLIPTILSR